VTTKRPNDTPLNCHRNRFCGLPSGVAIDPALTASATTITRRRNGSGVSSRNDTISGTTTNSATSFVSHIESTAANTTSSIASPRSERT